MFKFANLSHRYPENANLKNMRRDSVVAPLERAVGLERAWERACFWQLRVRSTTQRKATLRKKNPLPLPKKRKKGLFCFGFASPCACTLFESCK